MLNPTSCPFCAADMSAHPTMMQTCEALQAERARATLDRARDALDRAAMQAKIERQAVALRSLQAAIQAKHNTIATLRARVATLEALTGRGQQAEHRLADLSSDIDALDRLRSRRIAERERLLAAMGVRDE
jgi:septal ring factor EnvC (AmiA/AmiB activator)